MPNIKRGMMAAAGVDTACEDCGLFVTGRNNYGQLGTGDTTNISSPVQAYAAVPISFSAGKECSAVIKTDNTLWMVGRNNKGQLGLGNTTDISSWTQVGSDTNWDQISCGNESAIARKTDGTIWTWGENEWGQLGDGTTVDKSSPVQVGSLTDWDVVLHAGKVAIGFKSDELWMWGAGQSGQLGNGAAVDYSSPVQIASSGFANGVRSSGGNGLFMVHLPKTDNTIVCTGYGYRGSLGLNGPTSTATFTQIGSAQWTWVQIGRYNNFGRRTNGELWSWGYAISGSVGDIPYPWVTRSSPVQIGSGETWGADFRHGGNNDYGGMAINTSGELFGWGSNSYGQKGGLPLYGMNTPTKIGSETDWTGVDCGAAHSLGVRDDS